MVRAAGQGELDASHSKSVDLAGESLLRHLEIAPVRRRGGRAGRGTGAAGPGPAVRAGQRAYKADTPTQCRTHT